MKTIIQWFEIPVTDMVRAKDFYKEVFQWELTEHKREGLHMCFFPNPSEGAGGALCHHPDFYRPGREGPVIYLCPSDGIDAALERLNALEATIEVPKTRVSPEHGYMAVFIDSEGNRIALYEH